MNSSMSAVLPIPMKPPHLSFTDARAFPLIHYAIILAQNVNICKRLADGV
jgi:hypothetical protein